MPFAPSSVFAPSKFDYLTLFDGAHGQTTAPSNDFPTDPAAETVLRLPESICSDSDLAGFLGKAMSDLRFGRRNVPADDTGQQEGQFRQIGPKKDANLQVRAQSPLHPSRENSC